MTLASQITYAERLARVSSNVTTASSANDITIKYINEGVREFCKVAGGIPKVGYLQLAPKFDVQTNWAVGITITGGANALTSRDWVLAATNTASVGAASFASYLGGQLSSTQLVSVSVSWDSTTWKFTIYDRLGSATYIEVDDPSGIGYVNAVDYVFNKIGTQTGYYWTGDVPLDLTLDTALPSDCLSVESVEWDRNKLTLAPFDLFSSPQSLGTPSYYAIKNRRIRLYPCPEEQEMFTVQYFSMPTDLSTTTDSCPLNDEYHMAPVYYAASFLSAENHDWDAQKQFFSLFINETNKAKIKEANQNPTLFPRFSYTPVRVEIPS